MDAVLKADYGDKDQKAKNDADAARVSAAGAGVRTMECSLPGCSISPDVSRSLRR
jgi:hypothetical protein